MSSHSGREHSTYSLVRSACRRSVAALPCRRDDGTSVPGSGEVVRTHYFVPDGRRRPGETPVRIALSPRLLIRMKSEVQVLPGPQEWPLTSRNACHMLA